MSNRHASGTILLAPTLVALLFSCALLAVGCQKQRIYSAPPTAGTNAKRSEPNVPAGATPAVVELSKKFERAADKPEQLGEPLPLEYILNGQASIFGDELIGFPMAGGEPYAPQSMVAGHRTLPLGSLVEVTNVSNGNKAVVAIADRGPFDKTKIINLSSSAAQKLGILDTGEVMLKVLGADIRPANKKAAPVGPLYYVQVGAFESRDNAQPVLENLFLLGFDSSRLVTLNSDPMTRVQAGPFKNRAAAQQALNILRADYPASFIIIPD